MGKRALIIAGLFFFICILPIRFVFCGQVVTKELSQWARQAIANEQDLFIIPSDKSVAVLYYQNLTGNASLDPLQKGLSVMLSTDLAKVKDLEVVERARLQALLDEIALGTTGLVDTETAQRAGRLVGARFLSGGDILKGSITQLEVGPNLLNVPEHIAINQGSFSGDLIDLIAIEKEILFDIIRLMNVALTPDQKAELEKPLSLSIPALLLLFKGIDASDHGNYSQAADLYKQALAKDPNLTPAQEALNEIKTLELITSREPISKSTETVKAQQPASSPKPAVATAKSGGLIGGTLKTTAVVLGLAAAGAGGYYVATADKDDDTTTSPTTDPPTNPPTNPPTSPPTTPPPQEVDETPPVLLSAMPSNNAENVTCDLPNVKFYFNEPMDSNYGMASVTSGPFTHWNIGDNAPTRWENNDMTLVIPIAEGGNILSAESENIGQDYTPTVNIELTGYKDIAGNDLETISHNFTVLYPGGVCPGL